MKKQPDHPKTRDSVGVLLINLGTPDATDYISMRRYLKEFLQDSRVVEPRNVFSRIGWITLLNAILLQIIPQRSGKNYAQIWDKQLNDSPLRIISKSQAKKLQDQLPEYHIDFAMRYGNPSISSKVNSLIEKGCKEIVAVPLYPQYSNSTTGSVQAEFFRAISQHKFQPAIKTVGAYYKNSKYLDAIANSIENSVLESGDKPSHIILSYHGIPTRYWKNGDPYPCQCFATSEGIKNRLSHIDAEVITTFQSKFGKEEWVGPATNETVVALAKKGYNTLAIATPAFTTDCVETLHEINIELQNEFIEAGGRKLITTPCLNDSPQCIDLLKHLVENFS